MSTLEQGIADLLGDEERRGRMATAGPRRAAAYDWRIVTQRYLDLMIALAESRPGAAASTSS